MTSFVTLALDPIPDYGFDKHFNDLITSNLNITNMTSVASMPYTDLFGSIFWGIVFAVIFVILWIQTEDITIPTLLGMIIGGSLWGMLPPEWTSLAASLTVVSFAGLVYSLIKRGQ